MLKVKNILFAMFCFMITHENVFAYVDTYTAYDRRASGGSGGSTWGIYIYLILMLIPFVGYLIDKLKNNKRTILTDNTTNQLEKSKDLSEGTSQELLNSNNTQNNTNKEKDILNSIEDFNQHLSKLDAYILFRKLLDEELADFNYMPVVRVIKNLCLQNYLQTESVYTDISINKKLVRGRIKIALNTIIKYDSDSIRVLDAKEINKALEKRKAN